MDHDEYTKQLILRYYAFRKLTIPSPSEAFLFLISEIGEFADILVSAEKEWVRNNPEDKKKNRADFEIADILMMLLVTSFLLNINPVTALKEKMLSKGFDVEKFDKEFISKKETQDVKNE